MSFYDILLAKKLGGGGGGSSVTVEPLSVTSNGTYSETGKAYSPVNVNVPTPSGSTNISANGTYDVTQYASASVAVPNSYTASDEGKVVSNGALVAQTSQTIDTNGTYDTTLKNQVVVNVSGGGGGGGITADDIAMRSISGVVSGSAARIYANAFADCRNITKADFSMCEHVESGAFSGCSGLTEVSLPVCTYISNNTFGNCISLASINVPMCRVLGSWAFASCSSLGRIEIPNCSIASGYAFLGCRSLSEAKIQTCKSIGYSGFANCFNLLSVDLTGVNSVTSLSPYAFNSTPIGGYTASTGGVYGSVFVPASLYNSFLSANNWSSISARIVSVP